MLPKSTKSILLFEKKDNIILHNEEKIGCDDLIY